MTLQPGIDRVEDVEQAGRLYLYLVATVAAVGGFLFGYDLSIVSGAIMFIKPEFGLAPPEVGFAVASAVLGCMLGPLLISAGLSDWLGRKKVLVMTAVIFGISAVGSALPETIFEFNCYRILGGIGVGVASIVSPMYIAEIAPARIRGRLVTVNQLAIVIGCLAAIIVTYFLSFTESWRWMFASECVPVLLLLVGLIFVPESPRWLTMKNRTGEALAVLTRANGRSDAQRQMREISGSLTEETGSWSELFRRGMRTALLIAVMLAILQQWAGVSPTLFYAPIIFQKAGFEAASDALRQAIILNVWNLSCVVLALWLVERLGRRPLLLAGCVGMALGLAVMGAFFYFEVKGVYFLLVFFFCVASYEMSLAPLAWLIMSEIFPTRIRGKAMAIATFFLWTACYAAAQAFPPLSAYLEKRFGSPAGIFWMYTCVCIFAVIFSWWMVPETKGKTLEEIGRSWTKGKRGAETCEE